MSDSSQPGLDFTLRSRRTDPASSHEAARKAKPRANSLAGRLLTQIRVTPGWNSEQLASWLSIPAYEVRKRTADLRNLGLVRNQNRPLRTGEVLRWWACDE